jgi:small glutamine-rich tetratricopeptide repeat-containing protein alpha
MADNKVLYNILSYLSSIKDETASNSGDVQTAIDLLETSFGIALNSATDYQTHAYPPNSFPTIFHEGAKSLKVKTFDETVSAVKDNPKFQPFFDAVSSKGYFEGTTEGSVEYMQRYTKLIQKFNERMNIPTEKSREEKEALAEEKKILGNTAVSAKDYETAIQHYTEALDLSNDGVNSHVYYCNRAAAYCYLNEYADAVADCEAAVVLAPDYVKAYSRLGLAYFFLGNFEKAVEAYTRADELEPNNESTKKSLKQAKKKLDEQKKSSVATSTGGKSSSGTAAGGMPDMAAMMGDPNLGGMMNSPFMKDAMSRLGGKLSR